MSDRSSDPGLSGNLRRSFLPSRAPTSYHRDQGGRSRWRHLLRLLREERQRRRFCCRPALQRHWRSRPGGCKIERLDQLFRSHSVLARGVGKIEIFAPGSDLAIVAQLEDCDKRNGRPFVITAGIIDPFCEKDRKSTRLNSIHTCTTRLPSSALKKKK